MITPVPAARHLLRAKDLIDARYREPLDVPTLARAARLSTAHFSREFRRSFGETWEAELTGLNLANNRYLLDTSNTFGGTHYADPRQLSLTLRYRFHY